MDGYLDFGSDSEDSDDGDQIMEIDSDEEDRSQNEAILKMLLEKSDNATTKSKKEQTIEDFEAEMEAELDRRAIEIESKGGLEHQKSISRSSSTSSLNQLALPPSRSKSPIAGPSSSKRRRGIIKNSSNSSSSENPPSKSVKFCSNITEIEHSSTTPTSNGILLSEASEEAEVDKSKSDNVEDEKKKVYEEIYFDSDESEGDDEVTRKNRRDKREFISDDDLFYDPNSDTKDQAWIDRKRRQYYLQNKLIDPNAGDQDNSTANLAANSSGNEATGVGASGVKIKALPMSDAVLNCPACFTVLCLDCQRHEFYNNQYRAMFVLNCVVSSDEVIHAPLKGYKRSRGRQQPNPISTSTDDVDDKFNPVKCKVCNTQIGVYDCDEVYHFVNVLASHS